MGDDEFDALRAELRRQCEVENEPPCDPLICGIMGAPCPRCQAAYVNGWIEEEVRRHQMQKDLETLTSPKG